MMSVLSIIGAYRSPAFGNLFPFIYYAVPVCPNTHLERQVRYGFWRAQRSGYPRSFVRPDDQKGWYPNPHLTYTGTTRTI